MRGGRMTFVRFMLFGTIALSLLTACMGDGGDDDPTQTPVVIVATEPETQADSEPTSTLADAPTPTATSQPTATPEPSSTPEPSPTPLPPRPTPTRPSINIPTPIPTEVEVDVEADNVELPGDPLVILPQVELAPAGMVLIDEGQVDLAFAAADAPDPEARAQQLTEWGFQGGAYRDMELPEDQIVDPDNQLLGLFTFVLVMGSPEGSQLEMQTYFDEILLADPDITLQEIAIDPVGDAHRAAAGIITDPDGNEFGISALLVTAGSVSLKFVAISGASYDPVPELVQIARVSLDNLGYSSLPLLGEVLLETDFSDWVTGPLDSGELYLDDAGFYHVVVDSGSGAFVSAYTTENEPFGDVAVSVNLIMVSGDLTSSGCLMIRMDQESQLYDYALCIDGNGNIEALYEQFDAEGNYSNEPLIPFGTYTVPPPTEWTNLAIVSRGDEFWFLVDGQVIDTVRHTGPPAGAVGIAVNHLVEAPEVPAEFAFTNLVVLSLQ